MRWPARFKLVRDLFALASGQLLSKILGFLAFAYLARTLDPAAYGTVEYAAGLAVIFGAIIEWGLGPVGAREIGRTPARAAQLAAQIPAIRLCLALAVVPVMALSTQWPGFEPEAQRLVLLFALALFALPWNQEWLLQGLEFMHGVALAHVVRMGTFALGVVLLVDASGDLAWVGLAEVLAAASALTYYLIVQRGQGIPIGLALVRSELWRLLGQGLPIGLTNMVWGFIQYAPLILLANLSGPAEAGYFGASQRIAVSLLTLSLIYHFNLFPAVVRRVGTAPVEFARLLRASFRVVAWLGIVMTLTLTMLAEPIITLVFGEAFEEASRSFALVIWALPVTLLSGHARWALVATGHQRHVLSAHLAGAATVVGLGVPLILLYDAPGAAAAMVVASLVIWTVSHVYAALNVGPVPSPSIVLRPAALAVIGALAGGTVHHEWAGAAVAAALCIAAAPLIDRKLLPDLGRLSRAKSDLSAPGASPP